MGQALQKPSEALDVGPALVGVVGAAGARSLVERGSPLGEGVVYEELACEKSGVRSSNRTTLGDCS